jgi:hypothetical protein
MPNSGYHFAGPRYGGLQRSVLSRSVRPSWPSDETTLGKGASEDGRDDLLSSFLALGEDGLGAYHLHERIYRLEYIQGNDVLHGCGRNFPSPASGGLGVVGTAPRAIIRFTTHLLRWPGLGHPRARAVTPGLIKNQEMVDIENTVGAARETRRGACGE